MTTDAMTWTGPINGGAHKTLQSSSGLRVLGGQHLRDAQCFFFLPKHRLGHPENYLFSLSKQIFSGSKYPKNILFKFENRSTGGAQWSDNAACHTSTGNWPQDTHHCSPEIICLRKRMSYKVLYLGHDIHLRGQESICPQSAYILRYVSRSRTTQASWHLLIVNHHRLQWCWRSNDDVSSHPRLGFPDVSFICPSYTSGVSIMKKTDFVAR